MFMRLIFHRGPWAGQEVVTAVPMLRIGNDASKNDLVLDDDQLAAAHCVLQRSSRGDYILEDLSATSTTINGRVPDLAGSAIYLSPGDRVELGSSEIEVADAAPRLIQISGSQPGREIPLSEDLLSFGRAPDNGVDIPDSEMSIYHAVIRCTAIGFSLEDQRSTNGSFVNGHKVSSAILMDGDAIRFGQQEFRFAVDNPEESAFGEDGPSEDSDMLAYLYVLRGGQQGETIELGTAPIVIGSAPDSDFVLTDPAAQAYHCRISYADPAFQVEDLGSQSGTYVNNEPCAAPRILHPGDLLSIGATIAEFRIPGGIAAEGGSTLMMQSVIAEGAYDLTPQPKYVINGRVESSDEILIGSSPSCHIQLDGEGINAMHCRIRWAGNFFIEDTSSFGTYIGDRRIVKENLQTGHVIRVGKEFIDVVVQGERCNLDVIDRKTAMAAIQVAHETAFDLRNAELDHGNIGGAVTSAYRTVYRLDYADIESLVQERKEKFIEGAPAWRPSTDLQKTWTTKIAVGLTLLASVALAVITYSTNTTQQVLVNHPLSESHSSIEFVEQAERLGIPSDCRACHSLGEGVTSDNCSRCHEGFDDMQREQHQAVELASLDPGRRAPNQNCQVCHAEHRAQGRFYADGRPTLLGAGRTCDDQGCHPNQHQEEFAMAKQSKNRPGFIEAGAVPDFDLPQEEFHIAHANVTLEDGSKHSIQCTTCHAEIDEATGELVEANPSKACFSCHSGGAELANSQCLSCHGMEHGSDHGFERLPADSPQMVAAVEPITPERSLAWAGLFMLALFGPVLGFASVARLRRRKAASKVVAKLNQFPVQAVKHLVHSINQEKCVGCHACVQACPTSVLELVNHKSQIVNFDACIQCRACEASCAFDALRMHDADKPPPSVKMPDVDNKYMTSVEGLFLIGQAAGVPQLKNASNMGRQVIEQMVESGLNPGDGRRAGADVDVMIIGSGPGGLSAAITCTKLGLSYHILEKERASAWTVRNYFHKGKTVMAEPNEVALEGHLPVWDAVREPILDAWDKAVQDYNIPIQFQKKVGDVKKEGQIFKVVTVDKDDNPVETFTAAKVLLAIGTLGTPRRLRCPGDDLEKCRNSLVDPDEFNGKNILVVGGTDSAIEVCLALAGRNKVWFSCRGKGFDRAKAKNRELIEAAFASGAVIPMFTTGVVNITDSTVTLEDLKTKAPTELPNDEVFAMIGGVPPTKWLESIGVTYVDRPHSWSPPRTDEYFKNKASG